MEGSTVARGEQLWQPYVVRGTIGGAVFCPAGPLAARTTFGVTVHTLKLYSYDRGQIVGSNNNHVSCVCGWVASCNK